MDLKYAEALLELPTSELKGGGGWKKGTVQQMEVVLAVVPNLIATWR